LPSLNKTVAEVARQEGISAQTLYNWHDQAKISRSPVPGKTPSIEQWPAEAKLAVIIETAVLPESELCPYCREKGLCSERVKAWKEDCLAGFQTSKEQERVAKHKTKADKAEISHLKKTCVVKRKHWKTRRRCWC